MLFQKEAQNKKKQLRCSIGVGNINLQEWGMFRVGEGQDAQPFWSCFLAACASGVEFCAFVNNSIYQPEMGACLVVNNLRENEKSTLPSPTPLRAEIQAELVEKPLPVSSSKKLRERSGEQLTTSIKSKSIIKNDSRSQNGSRVLDSNRSLQGLEGMDTSPRPVKHVVIAKEPIAASIAELSERRAIHQQDDEEEEDERDGSENSEEDREGSPELETPSNRLCEPDGDMLNRGLTDTDNRMIALTVASKEPLRLNAVKLKNGSIYNGEWLGGKRHGKGVLTWEDGSRYEGEWRHNFSWGHGLLTFNQHQYYQGSFVRNCRQGKGRYVNFGLTYEGEWRNDKQEGRGTESWGNGEHYEGEWLAGCKNGQGEIEFEDGSYYKGEFCGNQIHGKGLYCWMNSRVYEGEWEHNRMSGTGVLTWSNGDKYQGQFKNDKMHGLGVFTHADRSISSGVFESGKKHGVFTETDPEGNSRQIEYYMGKRLRRDDMKPHKFRNQSCDSKTLSSVTHSF